MVSLLIGIQRQTSPHCRNEGNTVRYTFQTTRFHSRGGHGQQKYNDATRHTIHESYRCGITRTNSKLWEAWLWRHGNTKDSIRRRPHNYLKSTPRLDDGTCRREASPILSGKELYSKRWGTTMVHSQDVPQSSNSRTPQRVRNIQLHPTALFVARLKDLC